MRRGLLTVCPTGALSILGKDPARSRVLPDLQQELGIPDDHTPGYVMSFGSPAVKDHRTAQREDGRINRIRMTKD